MTIGSSLRRWAGMWMSEGPKSPWGGNGGNKGGDGDDSSGGGPRNPWAFPPEGKRPRPGGSTTLDELLKRARRGGGSGGPGGPSGGMPTLPGGKGMWALIIGGLLVAWVALTSFHTIGPEQRGVVTYLGRFGGVLGPGIYPTWPAPFASVAIVNVDEIQVENFPKGEETNLMITGDQNIVDLTYQVSWNIANPEAYIFQIENPEDTVRSVAESAMRAVVATSTLDETLGAGRDVIEVRVQQMMQDILDEYNSGVQVRGVAIKNAAPPSEVEDAFKAVTAAQQQVQTDLDNARAYAGQIVAQAQGNAAEFDKLYEQYRLAPEVTRRRMYYETMERVLEHADTTVVEAPGVTPYLPLPELRRRAAAGEQTQAQPQSGQKAGGN
ncbi:MAG: protease modulator HflK [Sphingomonas sp.]|nr:protease modulator HflK [Sphingomonas sp.]